MKADEIINQYGYLVKSAVKQIDQKRLPSMIELADLSQCGYIELLRCSISFKNDGRAKFTTYADKCIRNHLKGVIADAHWGPRHAMQHYRKKNGKDLIKDMVSYDSFLEIEDEGELLPWIESIGEDSGVWKSEPENKSRTIFFDANKKNDLIKKIHSLLKRKEGAGICVVAKNKNTRGGYRAYAKLGKRIELGLYSSEEEAKTARGEFLTKLLIKLEATAENP